MRMMAALGVGLLAAGCAAASPAFPPEPRSGTLFNSLHQPGSAGPLPAVVVLHTCAGLRPHVVEWAEWLRGHGYAALVVDSFTPRGVQSVCGNWAVSVDDVTADALAALQHLRGRPGIDLQRIGVVGFSYGAMAALRLASARYQPRSAPGFLAAVAVYPVCASHRDAPLSAQQRLNNLYDDTVVPALVLIGDADTEAPNIVSNCVATVERLQRAGRPVAIKLFPGAPHGFDQPSRYDAQATQQARVATREFFDRHLRGAQAERS